MIVILKENTMASNRSLIALALLGLSVAVSPSSKAQLAQASPPTPAGAAPPQTKPATQDEQSTYLMMGTINMCVLSERKQPFNQALEANSLMVFDVIASKHGSQVVGNPNKINPNALIEGAAIQIIERVKVLCGKTLSPEWTKGIEDTFSAVRKQSTPTTPAK